MTILITVNNGQPIPLMLYFTNISIRKYCQNIDDWTKAGLDAHAVTANAGPDQMPHV